MVTHFSILVWRIPRTEEPGRASLWGPKESERTEQLHFNTIFNLFFQHQKHLHWGIADLKFLRF